MKGHMVKYYPLLQFPFHFIRTIQTMVRRPIGLDDALCLAYLGVIAVETPATFLAFTPTGAWYLHDIEIDKKRASHSAVTRMRIHSVFAISWRLEFP